eukprot:scaffold10822_cov100-Skeletonema_menzelii.AAC.1
MGNTDDYSNAFDAEGVEGSTSFYCGGTGSVDNSWFGDNQLFEIGSKPPQEPFSSSALERCMGNKAYEGEFWGCATLYHYAEHTTLFFWSVGLSLIAYLQKHVMKWRQRMPIAQCHPPCAVGGGSLTLFVLSEVLYF